MPDIVIAGATYPDVPSIIIPTNNNDTATFYSMTGNLDWLGPGIEEFNGQFYEKIDNLYNTLFNGWTASTTAKGIVASVTLSSNKIVMPDVDKYTYYIIWECGSEIAYDESEVQTALPLFSRSLIIQALAKRPSSWANITASISNSIVNQAAYTGNFLRYYNDKSSLTYTWAASYGFYCSATAPTISSTTVTSPTITLKTPVFNARCSTTYFSTGNAEHVAQKDSVWWIRGAKIYRAKSDTFFDGIYKMHTSVVNSAAPALPSVAE